MYVEKEENGDKNRNRMPQKKLHQFIHLSSIFHISDKETASLHLSGSGL